MIMQNVEDQNQEISDLCDWVEEQQILQKIMPGYANDPVDVDREGCFV